MFLFRIVFWSAIVLVTAPRLGVFALPQNGTGSEVVNTVRADVVAGLQRVKAELAQSPVLNANFSRS